jgi:hypothetical protein
VERRAGAGSAGVLVAAAPWRPAALSLELWAAAERRAARARVGTQADSWTEVGIIVSDLLLLIRRTLPFELDVVPHARSRHAATRLAHRVIGKRTGSLRKAAARHR